jgi:Na+-transporting NADH:ubiquinone oxidoreductase subunit NqrF
MTICLETSTYRWNGQDGDQVTITEAPEGSTFHAVDTGRKYVFHDGGWAEDLRDIYVAEHI